MRTLLRPIEDLLSLIFPRLCLACAEDAPAYGQLICTDCSVTMPETDFHLQKENPITERFWGRVEIQAGAALYIFTKGNRVQHLLHNLKYHGKKEIGEMVGRRLGYKLKESPHFSEVDLIVPVPLHPKKELFRGYNQSAWFGQGLSEVMGVPMLADGLKRNIHAESLTKKSRMQRLGSVEDMYVVPNSRRLQSRHILLVDDVLTTGSTLEACASQILEVPGAKVSFATIAMAMR